MYSTCRNSYVHVHVHVQYVLYIQYSTCTIHIVQYQVHVLTHVLYSTMYVPLRRRRYAAVRCGTAPYRSAAYLVAVATMRGAQLGCVYWLFCAIYLFAVLGLVVASGGSGDVPAQLAASAPALLVGGPPAASRLLEATVEAAVRLC